MKTQDGRLIVVSGASRCGKSTQVARIVRSARRAVAWDPEDQWSQQPGFRKITTRKALLEAMQTPGHMKLAYVTGGDLKEEFNFLCGCVMYAGRYIAPLDYIAEELADVTTPSKAPGNWGILVRRGLKRGINIYAISQRWAEADKTAIGNASEYIVFASRGEDVAYISKKTLIPMEEIAALKQFEFVMFDPVTKEKSKKKVAFLRQFPGNGYGAGGFALFARGVWNGACINNQLYKPGNREGETGNEPSRHDETRHCSRDHFCRIQVRLRCGQGRGGRGRRRDGRKACAVPEGRSVINNPRLPLTRRNGALDTRRLPAPLKRG